VFHIKEYTYLLAFGAFILQQISLNSCIVSRSCYTRVILKKIMQFHFCFADLVWSIFHNSVQSPFHAFARHGTSDLWAGWWIFS